MTDVYIPGIGTVSFPEGMPMEQIQQEAQRLSQTDMQSVLEGARSRAPSGTAVEGMFEKQKRADIFWREAMTKFMDNFIGLPENVANLILSGAQKFGTIGGIPAARGLPQEGKIDLGLPTATEAIMAPAQMAGEVAGALATGDFSQMTPFRQAVEQQQEALMSGREQSPAIAQAGSIAGDVATLLAGRPVARSGIEGLKNIAPRIDVPRNMKPFVDSLSRSRAFKTAMERAGRSAEAGLEGAAIAILNDGDPIEMASYAAGGQAIGSMALWLSPVTRAGAARFGGTMVGLWAMTRMAQDLIPGIDGNAFTALDFTMDKAAAAFITGLASGAMGLGRVGTPDSGRVVRGFAESFPNVASAITAIPRTAVISLTNDILKEKEQGINRIEPIMQAVMNDPEYFGNAAQRRIQRAIEQGTFGSETINSLMEDRTFRRRFEQLMGENNE